LGLTVTCSKHSSGSGKAAIVTEAPGKELNTPERQSPTCRGGFVGGLDKTVLKPESVSARLMLQSSRLKTRGLLYFDSRNCYTYL